LSGTIIWSRGQSAGIRLDKPIDADAFLKGSLDDPGHRRRMPRAIVEASGTLNVGPFGYHANIVDISPAGARVRTIKPLVGVGPVSLRLPHLSAIPARICWFEDSDAGLRFNAPLEMRVLEEWLESERAGSHPR
jgi:hypothetical protein